MRISRTIGLVVLLLSLSGGRVYAQDDTRQENSRADAVDVDLGTATLGHFDMTAGPFAAAVGLYDRAMIGTYTLPWIASAAAPGSVVPNVFAKVRLFSDDSLSASLSTSIFYARLEDGGGQELKIRAWILPVRALFEATWRERFSTTLEFTSVYASLTGDQLIEAGTRVQGLALARSFQTGVIQRWRANDTLSLWGRARLLLGHSPLVAEANSQVSESVRVTVQARANAAELSSGVAAVGGIHLQWPRYAMSAGAGYGTWFLPGIYLPVGDNTVIGEFDFYFRF
jgi:hypothetical protein